MLYFPSIEIILRIVFQISFSFDRAVQYGKYTLILYSCHIVYFELTFTEFKM